MHGYQPHGPGTRVAGGKPRTTSETCSLDDANSPQSSSNAPGSPDLPSKEQGEEGDVTQETVEERVQLPHSVLLKKVGQSTEEKKRKKVQQFNDNFRPHMTSYIKARHRIDTFGNNPYLLAEDPSSASSPVSGDGGAGGLVLLGKRSNSFVEMAPQLMPACKQIERQKLEESNAAYLKMQQCTLPA